MSNAPHMRVLRAGDYHLKPWKNGQGVTRDILLLPAAENFDIRVSLADIPPESTFSAFPGITRHITLVTGEAMTLHFAAGQSHALKPLQPLTFDSGKTPLSRASDGLVRVLNVMTRNGKWHSGVTLLRVGEHRAQPPSPGVLLLFAAQGRWVAQAGAAEAEAAEGETLLVGAESPVRFMAASGSTALLATLTPCGPSDLRFF